MHRVVALGLIVALAIAACANSPEAMCRPHGTELRVVAEGHSFGMDCLAAPEDQAFTIAFRNEDTSPHGVHNIAIYRENGVAVFSGKALRPASTSIVYEVQALAAGTYVFRCDNHPLHERNVHRRIGGEHMGWLDAAGRGRVGRTAHRVASARKEGFMEPATRSRVGGQEQGAREMPFSYGSRRIWVPAMAAFLLVLMSVPMARAAQPEWDSWDFRLLDSLNQARDPATSQTIVLTGKGSFDISPPGSISGGGGFTILDAGGAVVDSGTWTARTLDLADTEVPSGPGGSPGENGHLVLSADFSGESEPWRVVIQCSMWGDVTVGPPGFPWPADFVEVGPYTTPVSGAVMFNLNH